MSSATEMLCKTTKEFASRTMANGFFKAGNAGVDYLSGRANILGYNSNGS